MSRGASGTLIAGALLHLGVPAAVVREAFDDAGLHVLGLRARKVTQGDTHGVHVDFIDEEGRPLLGPEEPRGPLRAGARAPLRRRHQAPHKSVRTPTERKAMGVAQPDESGTSDDRQVGFETQPGRPQATLVPIGGTNAPALEDPARPPESRGPLHDWLHGEQASASALLAFVTASALAPVPKAIARKTLRRALEARAGALGHERLDEPTLPGALAVALLAEAVACAALLSALSPARVSASAICLDTAPDPWLDAVLLGMRAREEDVGFSPTTPLGAAFVWAVAHRSGPRGAVTLRAVGSGVGRAILRGRPELSRALYADDAAIDTRAGAGDEVPLRRLEAVLDRGDHAALLSALGEAGASGITTVTALDVDGRTCARLLCTAPESAVEKLTQLLLSASACEVLVSTVERRQAEHGK